MNIELKNVKHSQFASHETNCFEASIYIDGKKAGTAENSGQGGCTSISPNTLYHTIKAHTDTLPPTMYHGMTLEQTPDGLIDDMLTEWLYARDLKKAMTKRIVFTRKGKMMETTSMPPDKLAPFLKNPSLAKILDADQVLNFLPFDAALQLYRQGVNQ
jgi:hypothetical protein